MGAFDKIVAAVSPRRACEREAWRQQLEILRGYDAAGYGRLNAGWRVHNESAEVTDRFSRDVVRARARDLERNSDIAQSILHAYKRNVVGKGYTLQAKTGNDELDEKLEKAWRQWCKARNCDVTGEQSFNQMLRMAVDRKKVDGGLLFLYRYTKQGLVPFQLQAIEVDELDVTASKPKHQGNRVVGGIEYNQWRRPVGYWINQYDIEGWSLFQSTPSARRATDPFTIKSVEQSEQTDCEFYMNLCNTYGLAMKVYAQKIVVYDREAYKKKGAAAVLSPSGMKSWSWQQDQAGTYTGGEVTYTSPATEKEIKVTVGKGSRILKQSGKADSKADAERKIKAAVAKANHGKTKLSATIVGNASMVASQCVQVVGLGKLSGKYYIDTITHNVSGSGGYTMDLEMSLVEE